jgi:hypothetical protein
MLGQGCRSIIIGANGKCPFASLHLIRHFAPDPYSLEGMILCRFVLAFIFVLAINTLYAQDDSLAVKESAQKQDTLSKFDSFNKKAERFFKVAPVPIVAYSTEAGNIFGLAKFNTFHLSKKDTVSRPSKISEVATFSTKGRVNISVSNDLIFDQDRYIIMSYFNYKKQPEFILGIGNDVSRDNKEEVTVDRIKFYSVALRQVHKKLYAGLGFEISDYTKVETQENSFLIEQNYPGLDGGTNIGVGVSAGLDNRDNRYNASKGELLLATFITYEPSLGSRYSFQRMDIDLRKYISPWPGHIFAFQASTSYATGTVPFYDLSQLGGEDKMRGYYKGALRDFVLVDTQFEYRVHIWNIFGLTTWIGAGRVGESYSDLSIDGFRLSYGIGLRIKVDSGSNVNLRIDFGFGSDNVSGSYLNFGEAF